MGTSRSICVSYHLLLIDSFLIFSDDDDDDSSVAENGRRGKVGKPAHLEEMVVTMKSTAAGESVFKVTFEWDDSQGIPGAVIVRNTYRCEYLLKTLTLEGVPGKGTVVFVANSWIYPNVDRVFFANDVSSFFLPSFLPLAAAADDDDTTINQSEKNY